MAEITLLLDRLNRGDDSALEELVPLVYQELRISAQRYLGRKQNGHTLQPTALVHEAFLKLAGGEAGWQGSRHFYNAAAEVMRQILVTHARTKARQKRGGSLRRVELDDAALAELEDAAATAEPDWEALDEALGELRELGERRYRVVMLRYFAGLTDAQIAATLGVSEKTAERDWSTAKVFLRARMEEPGR